MILALFFGAAAPLSIVTISRRSRAFRAAFLGTVGYSVGLFVVGNISEYRLWLPLMAMPILSSARLLEDRCSLQPQA